MVRTFCFRFGDVPKWLKGPHSKCGRSGNRRESSNLSISVTNATEEGCEVYFENNILRSLFTLHCISIMVRWTNFDHHKRENVKNIFSNSKLYPTTNTSVLEKPPVNHPPPTKIANTQPGGRYIREGTAFCVRLERVLRSCAYVDFRECQLALMNHSRS